MNSILDTVSELIDYIIADDDKYSDEEVFQLATRLQSLAQDCLDSIDYGSE